ncbi:hypothetical protein L226DRAFT_472836 [Lentinus tigrinus ALCF2SS1-7]|uniref:Uncharacterized protein n=1 Tax=Lentinus tigrinus ALCF2SS1-6 TaxID=1328759 RepID=A0A5C2S6M9_9APHY|nr:hypothetical protein L227DRAFT_503528 [Lentinus tigrinus ALCF2SS1-6]RPD68744.1 hypothetical protein L226DRAFT_472836 [Lentinus tigrinus ALCF2SS1-7]
MQGSATNTSAAWDIYAKELIPLRFGYPLWGAEPDSRFGEVQLGDVGYLREGYFCFIFNAMSPADDPRNLHRGVPDDFEMFRPPNPVPVHRPNVITQYQLRSRNVRSSATSAQGTVATIAAGIRFTCTEETGALLVLKDPGHKTYLDCGRHIARYMQTHLPSWYEFAAERLGIDIEEKDLMFISGFTKTTVWGEAAFKAGAGNSELVLSAGAASPTPLMSGEIELARSHASDPLVIYRSGPPDRVPELERARDEKFDQCIFLNFYKMKRRIWRQVIRAAAGPHELPSSPDDETGSSPLTASVCTDSDGLGTVGP